MPIFSIAATTTTEASGGFQFLRVPNGTYQVSFTATGFLEGFSDEALGRLQARVPLARLGQPRDVWQAVRFILECDFFTARTVEVDGGAAMGMI